MRQLSVASIYLILYWSRTSLFFKLSYKKGVATPSLAFTKDAGSLLRISLNVIQKSHITIFAKLIIIFHIKLKFAIINMLFQNVLSNGIPDRRFCEVTKQTAWPQWWSRDGKMYYKLCYHHNWTVDYLSRKPESQMMREVRVAIATVLSGDDYGHNSPNGPEQYENHYRAQKQKREQ